MISLDTGTLFAETIRTARHWIMLSGRDSQTSATVGAMGGKTRKDRAVTTYKDIQRATGLSLATISKYYNGRNVLEANRESIEAAARELDFRPNQHARMLRSRRSRTVGGQQTANHQ